MFVSLRSPLALGLLLCSFTAALPGQELIARVQTLLTQAEAVGIGHAFDLGNQIADLADANTDPTRDAIVRAAEGLGAVGKIAATVALQGLKDDVTYSKDIFAMIKPVAESTDPAVRSSAMALLGEERYFNTKILPEVRKILDANCKDELQPPQVRIEAAQALWHVGTNDQRGTAKTTLQQFLQSTDRDLRIRGALALAELNTESGPAFAILRDIQHEPSDAGRRARLYIKREEERREFERLLARALEAKPVTGGGGNREPDEYRVLTELRQRIRAQHIQGAQFTDQELIEFAAKGLLQGLDPHSTFFTSDEFQKFFFDLRREYGGIGAFVNFDQDNDFAIVRPIYSGPAYVAGLRSGDKILEVDGWETAGHTSDEIIARLKGRPDTKVVLKVFRPGWQGAQDLTINRQQIHVPAVNSAMIPGEIGYIELINFSANLAEELGGAIRNLQSQGAKGLVLDVRNNTGGFLNEARDVVELFVEGRKLVVYTQGPAEDKRDYLTRNRAITNLPLAVLTNNFSASASEITAGALQEHNRAVVIGERSYGKGSVQNMMPLSVDPSEEFEDLNQDNVWQEGEPYTDRNRNGKFDVGAHIKLTVAKYYLPSGRCPHREFDKEGRIVDPAWGVIPDKEIDLLENKPEDAWKNAAVFALLRKGVFKDYVKKHLPGNPQLFQQLAEGDDGDFSRYPEFDAFYKGLDTKLSEDDVRRWLRYEVRDQVADLRRAVYPGGRAVGDPQEDAQLQEAVRQLLQKRGEDIRTVAAYKNVLKIQFGEEPRTGAK
ncbi:MAG: PDZ domain-containing protein [Planctomycetes bacterium]|nr:PDZ domain-containing protein [Planctomycetota bacterium]